LHAYVKRVTLPRRDELVSCHVYCVLAAGANIRPLSFSSDFVCWRIILFTNEWNWLF